MVAARDEGADATRRPSGEDLARVSTAAHLIARVLPSDVACEESFGDRKPVRAFAAEQRYVARAVPRRRAEFHTARECARDALAALGLPPVAIPPAAGGAPQWPTSVVGSITHCGGYRAAAVAPRLRFEAVGIDAETAEPLPPEVRELAVRPEESRRGEQLECLAPETPWSTIIFSVKEAIFKAWYPATGDWLDFDQACVRIEMNGRWRASVLHPSPRPVATLDGRWLVDRGLVVTGTVVRRPA